MWGDFKKFILRGNVIDMGVGIVIGAAFTSIVNSFVTDLLMPPVGVITGGVDYSNLFLILKPGKTPPPYETLKAAADAGAVTFNYGQFLSKTISFLIVSAAVFLLVRMVNRLAAGIAPASPAPPTTMKCSFCRMDIPVDATRCGHCTSDLKQEDSLTNPSS